MSFLLRWMGLGPGKSTQTILAEQQYRITQAIVQLKLQTARFSLQEQQEVRNLRNSIRENRHRSEKMRKKLAAPIEKTIRKISRQKLSLEKVISQMNGVNVQIVAAAGQRQVITTLSQAVRILKMFNMSTHWKELQNVLMAYKREVAVLETKTSIVEETMGEVDEDTLDEDEQEEEEKTQDGGVSGSLFDQFKAEIDDEEAAKIKLDLPEAGRGGGAGAGGPRQEMKFAQRSQQQMMQSQAAQPRVSVHVHTAAGPARAAAAPRQQEHISDDDEDCSDADDDVGGPPQHHTPARDVASQELDFEERLRKLRE